MRLNGQADGIVHSYYSPKRTYTIWLIETWIPGTINADAVTDGDVITAVTDTETIYAGCAGCHLEQLLLLQADWTTANRTETGTTLESGNGAAETLLIQQVLMPEQQMATSQQELMQEIQPQEPAILVMMRITMLTMREPQARTITKWKRLRCFNNQRQGRAAFG